MHLNLELVIFVSQTAEIRALDNRKPLSGFSEEKARICGFMNWVNAKKVAQKTK